MKPGIRFEISWTLKANTRDEKFGCFLYKQGLKKKYIVSTEVSTLVS